MNLTDRIELLKGMGPKTAAIFNANGIRTVEDFAYFFPRGWIDATTAKPIAELRLDQSGLIEAQVVTVKQGMSQKTRKPYLRATVADMSGSIDVIWFYATYLKQKVKPGAQFKLYGKVRSWGKGERAIISPRFIVAPSVIPVYSEIGGLRSQKIIPLMQQVTPLLPALPDFLPAEVRDEYHLLALHQALQLMHFPGHVNDIDVARKRLAFDELLMLVVPSLMAKRERAQEQTQALHEENAKINTWFTTLPFPLTNDQQTVINEILADMSQTKPMNRLVQGDVGSGKTIIGLAGACNAIFNGRQAVWLAPTELLAKQHFETAKKLLEPLNISIGLWTRTSHFIADGLESEKANRDTVTAQSLIIGTHALLSEKIEFQNLGLLVIDEQHRFGVQQRAQLRTFGGRPVHLLSMTATPIPRTMALLLYGDLSLSVIKEKPIGRKPVVTKVVRESDRAKAYEYIDSFISKRNQAFVVCPLIEPTQDEEANVFNQLFQAVEEKKSVVTWFEKLKQQFPHRKIGMLHGKMKPAEKESVMQLFRNGELDILVSTTVIEVGVDVPNANIMIIESAERFGLAQLHQLRGRVGRSEKQALCLLFPSNEDKLDNERLRLMEQTNDGFILAEKDLELRGPGEVTGIAQSGIPPLKFASLKNTEEVAQVRQIAEQLLDKQEFQESFQRFWRIHHPE